MAPILRQDVAQRVRGYTASSDQISIRPPTPGDINVTIPGDINTMLQLQMKKKMTLKGFMQACWKKLMKQDISDWNAKVQRTKFWKLLSMKQCRKTNHRVM